MKAITKVMLMDEALNALEKQGIKHIPIFAVKEILELAGKNMIVREALEKIVQDQTGWDRNRVMIEVEKAILEIKENINPRDEIEAMKDVITEVEALITIIERRG